MKANLKRRRMQISLPGPSSNGTSASIPIINPHPSHNQSLHDAVGPIGGQIRSEMWPLQFLESIDKQRSIKALPSLQQVCHIKRPPRLIRRAVSTHSTLRTLIIPIQRHRLHHR